MECQDPSSPDNDGNGATPCPPLDEEAPLTVLDAPPQRVGLLLADVRTRAGLSLATVSERLGGSLGPAELMALESGAFAVEPALFGELADLYGVRADHIVPPRDHLVVDLGDRYMRAGPDIALLDRGVGRHDVLSRYLEMLWELRAVEPGAAVTLRDDDMAVLGSSLRDDPDHVRSDLATMMAGPHVPEAGRSGRRRVLVGLGVAIAVVTGGSLFVAASGSVDAAPVAALGALPPNPQVTIGEAFVQERGSAQVPRTEGLPAAPSPQIGSAVVQERNPDGTPGEQRTR